MPGALERAPVEHATVRTAAQSPLRSPLRSSLARPLRRPRSVRAVRSAGRRAAERAPRSGAERPRAGSRRCALRRAPAPPRRRPRPATAAPPRRGPGPPAPRHVGIHVEPLEGLVEALRPAAVALDERLAGGRQVVRVGGLAGAALLEVHGDRLRERQRRVLLEPGRDPQVQRRADRRRGSSGAPRAAAAPSGSDSPPHPPSRSRRLAPARPRCAARRGGAEASGTSAVSSPTQQHSPASAATLSRRRGPGSKVSRRACNSETSELETLVSWVMPARARARRSMPARRRPAPPATGPPTRRRGRRPGPAAQALLGRERLRASAAVRLGEVAAATGVDHQERRVRLREQRGELRRTGCVPLAGCRRSARPVAWTLSGVRR
jgi:hypothetical protein